jgi:hypothetical protein
MGLFDAIGNLVGNVAGGIIGGSVGRKQQQEGQRMIAEAARLSAQYQRPEMQTPEGIQAMTRMAQGQMYQRMPGATQYENQIQGSTAAGMSAIQDMSAGSEGIGAIANLYGNQQNQMSNLAIQNANFQQQGQQNYMGALQGLGQWQQQAWQWNKADPYMMAQDKAAQLDQFGRMNQFQGYKTRAGAWAETAKGLGQSGGGLLDEIFNKG